MSLDSLLDDTLKQYARSLDDEDFSLDPWMDEDDQKVFAYNAWKANGSRSDDSRDLSSYLINLPHMPRYVVVSTLAYMVRTRTP